MFGANAEETAVFIENFDLFFMLSMSATTTAAIKH